MRLHLYFYADSSGELQVHEGVDGFACRLFDIDEAFVRQNLELFAVIFFDVRAF